jgi:hypothetical protein
MLNSIFRGYIHYQHFKGLKRGVLRAFWDLKTENAEHMNTTARER